MALARLRTQSSELTVPTETVETNSSSTSSLIVQSDFLRAVQLAPSEPQSDLPDDISSLADDDLDSVSHNLDIAETTADDNPSNVTESTMCCIKWPYENEPKRLLCSLCLQSFHTICEGFRDSDASLIDRFVCSACSLLTGSFSHWKQDDANEFWLNEKQKHYYDIEDIVNHEEIEINGEIVRFFEIKWHGYAETTWEPEQHLDGCLDVLQNYCVHNNLVRSSIEGHFGYSEENEYNKDNWVTISKVLETYDKFENRFFKDQHLSIEEWSGNLPSDDSILIIPLKFHLYVGLYISKKKLCIIADGGNQFFKHVKLARDLSELINCGLVSCYYEARVGIDHCGSSAVLIALEMKRAYFSGQLPIKLSPQPTLSSRVIKFMHKSDTKFYPANSYSVGNCLYCQKGFRLRKKLLHHQLMCNLRK